MAGWHWYQKNSREYTLIDQRLITILELFAIGLINVSFMSPRRQWVNKVH